LLFSSYFKRENLHKVSEDEMGLVQLLGQALLGYIPGIVAKFTVFASSENLSSWSLLGLIGCAGAVLGARLARQLFGQEKYLAGWSAALLSSLAILAAARFYS
jgi:hypothetical protein